MKKNIIISILLCLLACTIGFGVTYSYLITQAEKSNVLTVGEVEVKVEEDYEPPEQLSPNSSFKKAPYATNTGNLPCYVRMRADLSTVKAGTFCTLSGENAEYWEKGTDGYYYYKFLLNPGEKTAAAPFNTVEIGDCNVNDLEDFDINVYAEAVQDSVHVGNHPANEYLTVWSGYHS